MHGIHYEEPTYIIVWRDMKPLRASAGHPVSRRQDGHAADSKRVDARPSSPTLWTPASFPQGKDFEITGATKVGQGAGERGHKDVSRGSGAPGDRAGCTALTVLAARCGRSDPKRGQAPLLLLP
jgi:hypothetical protein